MCGGSRTGRLDDMLTNFELELRLERARARRDAQPAFSPDWDAAMESVDDLTRQLWHVEAARLARLAILARSERRDAVAV